MYGHEIPSDSYNVLEDNRRGSSGQRRPGGPSLTVKHCRILPSSAQYVPLGPKGKRSQQSFGGIQRVDCMWNTRVYV